MAFSAFTNQYVNMLALTVSVNTQGLANTFYFTNTPGTIDIALPVNPTQGDMFGARSIQGAFNLTQAAGQQVRVVGDLTTLGTDGYIFCPSAGCGLILKYEASTHIWVMDSVTGGLSVN